MDMFSGEPVKIVTRLRYIMKDGERVLCQQRGQIVVNFLGGIQILEPKWEIVPLEDLPANKSEDK